MKKLILFIVSFCFINVYAANDISLQCEYKTSDTTYRVIIPLRDNNNDTFVSYDRILISRSNSNTGTYTEPEEVKDLSYYIGTDQYFQSYGVTSASSSYSFHSRYDEDFAVQLRNNPQKYCPVLMFNENNEPILFGSYFEDEYFEETKELGVSNVNEAKEAFEKILKGELTPTIGSVEILNFYRELRLKEAVYYTTKTSIQNVNISDVELGSGIDWNASTCREYNFLLKQLQETIAGPDGNGGVCSASSLNKLQSSGSLYDLENNFDRSVLEDECANYVFGSGGKSYIDVIVDAQMFYFSFINDTEKAYSMNCLSMQTRYLNGITLLTTYNSYTENKDATGCNLIGEDVLNFLDELFNALKIVCVAVCVFLCIVDIYKVIVSKELDSSKFQKSLMKRIIALVVIFLLPIFVSIIADYVNERYMKSKGDICLSVIGA